MNGLPYYKAYPRDFFEGTAGMPVELKGIYRLILDLIYMQGGALVDDPRYIAGHLGCAVKTWTTARAKLIAAGKIYAIDERLRNNRADKEQIITASFLDKQRINGSAPKKNNGLRKAVAKPKASHTEPEPDTDKNGGGGSAREAQTDREAILAAIGVDPVSGLTGHGGRMIGTQADMAEAARWRELPGMSVPVICEEIRRIMAGKRDGPPKSFRYFTEAMQRLSGQISAPPINPIAPAAGGKPNERRAFDQTIATVAAGLSDGTIAIDHSSRDPFAVKPRRDPDPDQYRVVPLLRP